MWIGCRPHQKSKGSAAKHNNLSQQRPQVLVVAEIRQHYRKATSERVASHRRRARLGKYPLDHLLQTHLRDAMVQAGRHGTTWRPLSCADGKVWLAESEWNVHVR
jgi:hypothetical protein